MLVFSSEKQRYGQRLNDIGLIKLILLRMQSRIFIFWLKDQSSRRLKQQSVNFRNLSRMLSRSNIVSISGMEAVLR